MALSMTNAGIADLESIQRRSAPRLCARSREASCT